MIDKLDVRIPGRIDYSKSFKKLFREVIHTSLDPFRGSHHYTSVGDLRGLGYQAILHLRCRHGKQGSHKVELVDTGTISLARMQHEIERIFDVDARQLAVMRIDLAADVEGLPVSWFYEHSRATWKRFVADFGQSDRLRIGKGEIQTVYFGKRPNCFRIYNKIAEWQHQYAHFKRASDAGYPPFEEVFGYPETGIVLTRVERQIGGSRIPAQVATLGDLYSIDGFNPFDRLQFFACGDPEPTIEEYGFEQYATGMFLRDRAEEWGMHRLRSWLNQHANRNAARILDRHEAFLRSKERIAPPQLFDRFQQSVSKQLAA